MFLSESVLEERLGDEDQLVKISKLISWNKIEGILISINSDKGRKATNPLKMFKALLLGQWHSLSDPGLERSLRVRLDFMEFTGFSLSELPPDETTLCRFRNKLVDLELMELLFDEVNQQLEEHKLMVKKASAAIVDATIIDSNARPKRMIEVSEDRNESKSNVTLKESVDNDARWLKKGNKFHYGYKLFARTNEEGFIEKVHVTSANEFEGKHLEPVLKGCEEGRTVLADKAYASKENRSMLSGKGLDDGIMHKAVRGKPLTTQEKIENKEISKIRYRVEQTFGTLKRRFAYVRSSYLGLKKTTSQIYLKAMCMNLLKAANLIKIA